MVKRADPVLKGLVKTGYERIAVVTHGGLIRVMAAYYTGIPLSRFRILGKIWKTAVLQNFNGMKRMNALHWNVLMTMHI